MEYISPYFDQGRSEWDVNLFLRHGGEDSWFYNKTVGISHIYNGFIYLFLPLYCEFSWYSGHFIMLKVTVLLYKFIEHADFYFILYFLSRD